MLKTLEAPLLHNRTIQRTCDILTLCKKNCGLPACNEDTFAGLDFCPFSAILKMNKVNS